MCENCFENFEIKIGIIIIKFIKFFHSITCILRTSIENITLSTFIIWMRLHGVYLQKI